ncbi:MAG: bifunctional phosphoglucose/phosphomannose isomerase [candidate division Zixibacteria bacterium]|nr:bifunctional phosphoglucose/phosphomannose isomerase [candidate division Zixibacteria bacterium]
MSNLDALGSIDSRDPGNMYGAICSLPDQIRTAVTLAGAVAIDPNTFGGFHNIILCGMGGSAIGGDLARSLLADILPIPMAVCRDYRLPSYAGPDTLVIVSSYSGNTEETLTTFDQARAKGCRLYAMTTGGALREIVEREHIPWTLLPGGLQPRAALGYSFVPLMLFLNRIGLSTFGPSSFTALADFLEVRAKGYALSIPSQTNPAKQLALRLYGRIPIIYSGPSVTDAVAVRFKGQINENAKMPAYTGQFPECNHNELVGWKIIGAFREFLRVLMLRDGEDHERVAARMDIVGGLIEKQGVEVIDIRSEGADRLQRAFSLIHLGDFVSFYLAVLNSVDPTPVEAIESLKHELARLPWTAPSGRS